MRLPFVALLVSLASASATATSTEEGRNLQIFDSQTVNSAPNTGPETSDILYARWFQDTPKVTYDKDENMFTLDFEESSDLNTDENMSAVFYDNKCRWDGETLDFEEVRLSNTEIYKPGYEGTFPYMKMTPNDETPPVWRPVLVFEMNTEALAKNPAIYDTDGSGEGVMKLCVRTSLGYGSTTMVGNSDDPVKVPPFQEVNFIESLLTLKFDLTSGFSMEAFAVEPKIRVETTVVKDSVYELLAYLCDPYTMDEPRIPARDELLPIDLTLDYVPAEGGGKREGGKSFVQGALITICVAPNDITYKDGIRLNGLVDFTWSRADPTLIEQEAIVETDPSENYLTAYDKEACQDAAPWCMFSSVLFADFYRSPGETGGSGSAKLMFKPLGTRQRRLDDLGGDAVEVEDVAERAQSNRRVQAGSQFGVSVPIEQTTYTGPPPLKITAGGPSLRIFSVLASTVVVSLLGAAALLV